MTSSTKYFTVFAPSSNESRIEEMSLPYSPIRIFRKNFDDDGNLATPEKWAKINEILKNRSCGFYKDVDVDGLKFNLLKTENNYIVYSDSLRSGKQGWVHSAQNEKGQWFVVKHGFEVQNEFMPSIEASLTVEEMSPVPGLLPNSKMLLLKDGRGLDLSDYLNLKVKTKTMLSKIHYLDIASDVATKIEILFRRNLLNCDIKLENMIYDEIQNSTLVVDFGMFRELKNGVARSEHLDGTKRHFPPEFLEIRDNPSIQNKKYEYNEQTLVYNFGAVLKEFFATRADFSKPNWEMLNKFIQKMTTKDPKSRPCLQEVTDFFQKLRKNTRSYFQVGIVDLDTLIPLLHFTDKGPAFFLSDSSILKASHEIQLVDTGDFDSSRKNRLASIVTLLRLKGIKVRPKLLIYPDLDELVKLLPKHFERLGKAENIERTFFRIIYNEVEGSLRRQQESKAVENTTAGGFSLNQKST